MNDSGHEGIAIIGVHGRFPGADSIDAFWENLVAGKESISTFSDAELAAAGLNPSQLREGGTYVPARGVLAGADMFDAGFFGIQPKEAEVMDPQHRVFLEACWEALEKSGYASGRGAGAVGLYAGASNNTYYMHALHGRPDLRDLVGADQVMLGNEKDYLATRVAYKLGLRGPAISLNTACSSSLVSVCLAQQALLTFQCDLAVAGGVSILVPQQRGYYFQDGSIGSPDGHTRTFDARAGGVVPGNGVTLVVLKRLEDAIADGDRIYAVIKGAALNNDGSQRAGFGAPGIEGQSEVISLAQDIAGFEPDTLSYIEAHGTATPIGDPIEITALTKAFRRGTKRKQFCAIGSVKTNIGHLDAAAGTAGLIKTALSLYHQQLPPSLHFSEPNPKLDLENSPFFVNATLRAWEPPPGQPRRAGVSSFGIGGTNCHVVVEEAPPLPPGNPGRPRQILLLSAKSPEALDQAGRQLAAHMRSHPDVNLADAAFTLQLGRVEFPERRAIVADSVPESIAALESHDSPQVVSGRAAAQPPSVVFLFPGQGAQYPGMGRELYLQEPVFAEVVDAGAEVLKPLLGLDIRNLLFAEGPDRAEAEVALRQTRLTQPSLFLIEIAFARLWQSWGVQPTAMIGHSVGEYVAACLAGVLTMDDALQLVARRAELVQAQPPGTMLAVRLPEAELTDLLPPGLEIAAVNAPGSCVASGPEDAITALELILADKQVAAKRLATSHAFHSPMMEPVVAPFTDLLRRTRLQAPTLPYVSNVSGRWITPEEATSPEYWAGHVRQAVRFNDGLSLLLNEATTVLIECGPSQTLSQLARQHPARTRRHIIAPSLGSAKGSESVQIRQALASAWVAGVKVDWKAFQGPAPRRRIELPTYPFQRHRFWPEPSDAKISEIDPSSVTSAPSPSLDHSSPHHSSSRESAPSDQGGRSSSPAADSVPATVSTPAPPRTTTRREHLGALIRTSLSKLSGAELSDTLDSASFIELGLDSLLLTQAATHLQRRFGVPISFRQLLEDLSSLGKLAEYLDHRLPADQFLPEGTLAPALLQTASTTPILPPADRPEPAAPQTGNHLTGEASPSRIEHLLEQQIKGASELLALLRGQGGEALREINALNPSTAGEGRSGRREDIRRDSDASASTAGASHGPFRPADRSSIGSALTPDQQALVTALIDRYTRRTAGSKRHAATNRKVLADPRSVAGFKDFLKEMVYPIYVQSSDGARLWDVDGNEYIDFVMGFGANLFGHRPPFVVQAIERQLALGFEIGPIQPLVGEVAALAAEMTGMERVAFCNTGSEAVLAAIRIARTVTGRDGIGVFSGAYHGIFDEVLVRPLVVNGEVRAAPIAPGIPESGVSQVRVYDWANPASLELIRRHSSELAAVLVEPVQSRRLDVQPREFLVELRQLTRELGIALIFDEVVTGFRFHPGGAQAWYGIRADLASYGKVVGGGFPIGLVAGASQFMDALDGGAWQFGDSSFPGVGMTFFAGTFVRHPLTLAVAKAVLEHLKREGPKLQERVASLATRTADACRSVIAKHRAPLHIAQASSMMYLTAAPDTRWGGLVFYMLRERGLHVWENRAIVFTTAHGEPEARKLVDALDECLACLSQAGFLAGNHPGPAAFVPGGPIPAADPQTSFDRPAAAPPPSGPREIGLTDAQREIWLAALLDESASRSYNLTFKIRLEGPLHVEALKGSLQLWMDRHDSLRASFHARDPIQQTVPSLDVPWEFMDCSHWTQAERGPGLDSLARTQGDTVFDLTRAPLLRVLLVRLSSEEHSLILTLHHLIADGWSFGVLLHELRLAYDALVAGRKPSLEPALQFDEYRALLDSPPVQASAKRSEEYWQRRFLTLPPALELPTERPRPRERSFAAGRVTVRWEKSFVQSLRQASIRQGTTLLVFLLGGFKSLLWRLSGQPEIVVGLPAAGQIAHSLQEPEGVRALVGHCVHLLPIRSSLNPEITFAEFLQSLKSTVLDAFDHQDLTLGRLIELMRIPRDPSRLPLAPIIFNLDRAPAGFQLAGLTTQIEELPRHSLIFDLSVNAIDNDSEIVLHCDYNADAFDAESVRRWMAHFRSLIESAAKEPTAPVSRLTLLDDRDRHQVLVDWNATQRDYPRDKNVHQLIEEQVRRTPSAVAVEFAGESLSYAELERRSTALAAELRRHGAKKDSLIGLYLERSPDLVVGVLGVLKSGGAYVPLDPSFPPERLAFMAEDAGLTLLVTQSRMLKELPPHRATVVCVNELPEPAPGAADFEAEPGADGLAYVIYTSGSTGKPKGVEVLHRGLVNLLNSMRHTPGLSSTDVLLAVTTLSFDIASLELLLPLICGAKVVIASREVAADGEQLALEIANRKITVLQATPTTWRLLLAAGWKGNPSLKVLCGGEAFPPDLARQLIPSCASVWNLYGPTETTIYSTGQRLDLADAQGPISIGRPIDNTTIYILDTHQQPAPIGVPGELFIGGDGLARGYRGRPDLTQERFVPNPFRPDTSDTLYRTGDLARWLPDGRVLFLGRLDHQVKLRGYRIELGEIESVIMRHSGVNQCVVTVREDVPGDPRLVAYVAAQSGADVDATTLRQHVRRFLPDYMVPQHVVVLGSLPLTPNGKIDRRALPGPDAATVDTTPSRAALTGTTGSKEANPPATRTEVALADLWKKVLGVRPASRTDSFFDLGGHSLLAVRLFDGIEKSFGCRLPLATILRAETLEALAAEIEATTRESAKSACLVGIRPHGTRPPFYCVHGGGGEVLFARDLVRHFPSDQPFFGLHAIGVTSRAERDSTIEAMAERYLREIVAKQPKGPYYLGGFCLGGLVAYEMAQRLTRQGLEVALVVMIDTYNPVVAALAAAQASSLRIWREKLGFQLGNLRALGPGERGSYFWRRMQEMLRGRTKRTREMLSQFPLPSQTNNHGGNGGQFRGTLEEFHHRVWMAYRPTPYAGDVLIIRPQTGFSFYNDPHLGWSELVQGKLDVVSIPVNPGGMLVEPFIGMIGRHISEAIS